MTRESRSQSTHGEASQRLAITRRNYYCPRATGTWRGGCVLKYRSCGSLCISWNPSGPFQWDCEDRRFPAVGSGPLAEAEILPEMLTQAERKGGLSGFISVYPIGQTLQRC